MVDVHSEVVWIDRQGASESENPELFFRSSKFQLSSVSHLCFYLQCLGFLLCELCELFVLVPAL